MSEKMGNFEPFQLVYFGHLSLIDISGMTFINPQHFMEAVQACTKLKEFRLTGCVQFHEHQLVKMLSSLQLLEMVDANSMRELHYISAYYIVTSLKQLRRISVEPKFPDSEDKRWEWLVHNFQGISFGHAIMRMFPHCGRQLPLVEDDI